MPPISASVSSISPGRGDAKERKEDAQHPADDQGVGGDASGRVADIGFLAAESFKKDDRQDIKLRNDKGGDGGDDADIAVGINAGADGHAKKHQVAAVDPLHHDGGVSSGLHKFRHQEAKSQVYDEHRSHGIEQKRHIERRCKV